MRSHKSLIEFSPVKFSLIGGDLLARRIPAKKVKKLKQKIYRNHLMLTLNLRHLKRALQVDIFCARLLAIKKRYPVGPHVERAACCITESDRYYDAVSIRTRVVQSVRELNEFRHAINCIDNVERAAPSTLIFRRIPHTSEL